MNQTVRTTPVPTNEMKAPVYGGPQRDAINSVVDSIVGDICGKIATLRHTCDDLEQQVLEGAAAAKHALQDHVEVCIKVNGEVERIQIIINEIKAHPLFQK